MRTIAQYSIRDPNGSDAQMISEEPGAGRASMSGSMLGMGRMEPASLKASLKTDPKKTKTMMSQSGSASSLETATTTATITTRTTVLSKHPRKPTTQPESRRRTSRP